jgi:hypothetical protein
LEAGSRTTAVDHPFISHNLMRNTWGWLPDRLNAIDSAPART